MLLCIGEYYVPHDPMVAGMYCRCKLGNYPVNLNKQTRLLVQARPYATIAKCHKTQQSLSHSDQTKVKTPQTGLHEPWNAGNSAAGTPALILNGSLVATYPTGGPSTENRAKFEKAY